MVNLFTAAQSDEMRGDTKESGFTQYKSVQANRAARALKPSVLVSNYARETERAESVDMGLKVFFMLKSFSFFF